MKKMMVLLITSLIFYGCAASKSNHIGISKIVSHPALDAVEKGIIDELAGFKPVLQFDLENANGDINTAASIANKFKAENVRLAVGIATPTSQALVNVLKDRPVIFSAVTDPVKAGLVSSINKGEMWVTGVSDLTPVKEQIELLLKLRGIKRLGIIYSSNEDNAVTLADMTKKVCAELGLTVVEASVTSSAEVKQAVQSIIDKVEGIYVSTDNTVVSAMPAVTEVALSKNIPVVSADPSSAQNGDILCALGFDYYKMGRATGRLIAEVLKGKKPENLPTRFMKEAGDVDVLINLDVAKKLNIAIPVSVMNSATIVIESGKVTRKNAQK